LKESYSLQNERYLVQQFGQGFSFTSFIKTYIPLSHNNRYYIYFKPFLGYENKQVLKATTTAVDLNRELKTIQEFRLATDAGMTFFIIDNVALDLSINVFNISHVSTTKSVNGDDSAKSRDGDVQLKLNLARINIGVSAYF
jgi:outer membrane protein W